MPYYTKRQRKKAHQMWREALPSVLGQVRARSRRDLNELIPDDVLLAEAEHYFDVPDVWAPEQWFARRLAGAANTQEQRDTLASEIRAELHERHDRGNRRRPVGLLDWPRVTHRSRRGEPPRQALEDEVSTDEA